MANLNFVLQIARDVVASSAVMESLVMESLVMESLVMESGPQHERQGMALIFEKAMRKRPNL